MPATKPKARDDLALVELDGEAVVYAEESGAVHHLNPTATVVFALCDGTATVEEIVRDLSGAFGVDAAQIEPEVRQLLREFRELGLLEGNLVHRSPGG